MGEEPLRGEASLDGKLEAPGLDGAFEIILEGHWKPHLSNLGTVFYFGDLKRGTGWSLVGLNGDDLPASWVAMELLKGGVSNEAVV